MMTYDSIVPSAPHELGQSYLASRLNKIMLQVNASSWANAVPNIHLTEPLEDLSPVYRGSSTSSVSAASAFNTERDAFVEVAPTRVLHTGVVPGGWQDSNAFPHRLGSSSLALPAQTTVMPDTYYLENNTLIDLAAWGQQLEEPGLFGTAEPLVFVQQNDAPVLVTRNVQQSSAPQAVTSAAQSGMRATTASLYVKNLPPDATELALYQRFSPFGALLSCKVSCDPTTGKCRGVGFVNYIEHAAAAQAMQALHGMRMGEGRYLHVSLQTPRVLRVVNPGMPSAGLMESSPAILTPTVPTFPTTLKSGQVSKANMNGNSFKSTGQKQIRANISGYHTTRN